MISVEHNACHKNIKHHVVELNLSPNEKCHLDLFRYNIRAITSYNRGVLFSEDYIKSRNFVAVIFRIVPSSVIDIGNTKLFEIVVICKTSWLHHTPKYVLDNESVDSFVQLIDKLRRYIEAELETKGDCINDHKEIDPSIEAKP